jgi:hypothetical protein
MRIFSLTVDMVTIWYHLSSHVNPHGGKRQQVTGLYAALVPQRRQPGPLKPTNLAMRLRRWLRRWFTGVTSDSTRTIAKDGK